MIRRKLILEFVKHCNVVEDAFKIYRHVNLSQEEAVKRGEFGVMDRKYFRLVLNFIISSFICLHYATLPEGTKNTKPLQLIMMHWGVFKLVRDRIEHTLLRFMIHGH